MKRTQKKPLEQKPHAQFNRMFNTKCGAFVITACIHIDFMLYANKYIECGSACGHESKNYILY